MEAIMATHEPNSPAPLENTLIDPLAVVGLVVAIILLVAAVVVYLI